MQYHDINTALASVRSRLDLLASIKASDLLIPGGPMEHYHRIIEEANEALLVVEGEANKLREELAQQHKRLDTMREGAFGEAVDTEEQLIAFRDGD